MGLTKLLDISRRSIAVYSNALTVTSNNIANVNNENYSRQRVVFSAEQPDISGAYFIGSGIKISEIERVRSQLIDNQRVHYNQSYEYETKKNEILANIENLYSEPSEQGLSKLMNDFFDSWNQLSVDPTSIPLRNNIINSSDKMNSKLSTIFEGYTEISEDVKKEAKEVINQVNLYSSKINDLNKVIYNSSSLGQSAPDLEDARDAAILDLSKLVNIKVVRDANNTVSVAVSGTLIVAQNYNAKFKLVEEDGKLNMRSEDDTLDLDFRGGELYALAETYKNIVPEHKAELDTVFNALMNEVNSLHNTGYNLNNPPQPGGDFYESYNGGSLKIRQAIRDDVTSMAVSGDGTNGNNQIALAISDLKNKKVIGTQTIADYYTDFVSNNANSIQMSEQNASSYKDVIKQLEVQQAEVTGVSVDEEMINVLKFQRSFSAAAKLIQVADETIDELLRMV